MTNCNMLQHWYMLNNRLLKIKDFKSNIKAI